MRRNDREITDIKEKLDILQKCKVCRLGLSENDRPYIVPLNYGYNFENNKLTLFFHSALEGKKIDILQKNNLACFEVDSDTQLIEGENPCNYSYAFKSIIGFGKISFLEDPKEKTEALNFIMKHQTDKDTVYNFPPEMLNKVAVYKMTVDEFTGKQKLAP